MQRVYRFLWIGILALSLVACIKPVNLTVPNRDGSLVVSATLTTILNTQEVRLYRLAAFDTKALHYAVKNAQVWITDNLGQRQNFVEVPENNGLYLPADKNYVGVVGNTYVLHIVTEDGLQYESSPERIRAVSPIKRVYGEEILTEHPSPKIGLSVSGFKVLLDTEDPATKGDYYRWTWVHYNSVGYCRQYDGYTLGMRYGTLVGIPCCQECWDIVPCRIGCTNILSDALINGKSITRHQISTIPYCPKDYYLEIRQYSISKAAYDYWRIVDQLSNNNGGLFDQAPAAIRSNLSCISNPEEEVYGLFEVSAVAEGGYFISRTNISKPGLYTCAQEPFPANGFPEGELKGIDFGITNCEECVESPYRTRIKPRFWTK